MVGTAIKPNTTHKLIALEHSILKSSLIIFQTLPIYLSSFFSTVVLLFEISFNCESIPLHLNSKTITKATQKIIVSNQTISKIIFVLMSTCTKTKITEKIINNNVGKTQRVIAAFRFLDLNFSLISSRLFRRLMSLRLSSKISTKF